MNTTDILLAAADVARGALSTGPEHALTLLSEVDVERVLATLPARAAVGAKLHPLTHRGFFLLASWEPADPAAVAVHDEVHARLDTMRLETRCLRAYNMLGEPPCAIYVSFASVVAAADAAREHRATWLATARTTWLQRCGPGATVEPSQSNDGERLVFSVPLDVAAVRDPLDRRPAHVRRPEYLSSYDVTTRPVDDVVDAAAAALQVPLWSFAEISAAWVELTGTGDVLRGRGLWDRGAVAQVPTVIFRFGGEERTYGIEEVYALTAAALLERAAAELYQHVKAKPSAPAPEPVVAARLPNLDDFPAAPEILDVPFTEPQRAGVEARALYPATIQLPDGVLRVVTLEGGLFQVETDRNGVVAPLTDPTSAAEAADMYAMFVEDAWTEEAAKIVAEAERVEPKPATGAAPAAKGTGPRAAAKKTVIATAQPK